MKKEAQYIDRIESYMGGTMDTNARVMFEEELEENMELAAAFREYKIMQATIEHNFESSLRQKLDRWEEEEKKGPWRRTLWIGLSIAAGVLVLIAAFFLFRKDSANKPIPLDAVQVEVLPPEEIAEKFYKEPPPWENIASVEQKAKEAYRSGNFAEVVDLLSPLPGRSPEMDYYLAHSHFQMQDCKAAISLFQDLALGNTNYKRRSEWYLLLARLANSDDPQVIENQLTLITQDNNHPFHDRSKQLSRYWEAAKAVNQENYN